MDKKAQTVSSDAMVAVALFTIAIIFFFTYSSNSLDKDKISKLQSESKEISGSISGARNAEGKLLDGSKVDIKKLDELAGLEYSELKDLVGLDADFCIHFEDADGNVIYIAGTKTGLGNSNVRVADVPCGAEP